MTIDDEDLADAWHKLQIAHLDFEQAPSLNTKLYSQRWDALKEALEAYERVLDRMKPRQSE
jgi:hypothetical protein